MNVIQISFYLEVPKGIALHLYTFAIGHQWHLGQRAIEVFHFTTQQHYLASRTRGPHAETECIRCGVELGLCAQ